MLLAWQRWLALRDCDDGGGLERGTRDERAWLSRRWFVEGAMGRNKFETAGKRLKTTANRKSCEPAVLLEQFPESVVRSLWHIGPRYGGSY